MRVRPIDEVTPGSILGQGLFNDRGDPLAQAGVALDASAIAGIKSHGYQAIFVDDPSSRDIRIVDPLSAATRARVTKAVRNVIVAAERVVQSLGFEAARKATQLPRSPEILRIIEQNVPSDVVLESVRMLVDDVMAGPPQVGMVSIKAGETFAFSHAVEVATVAATLGRAAGLKTADLRRLALGALLHDIGQVFTGDSVDGKTTAPTPAEIEHIKRHTRLGFDFLQNVPAFDPVANHVAYEHHEWHSGGGLPRGLASTDWGELGPKVTTGQILLIAQITSLADLYDGFLSDRPFRQRLPRELAFQLLRRTAGAQINGDLAQLFTMVVPMFPVGYGVRVVGGAYDRWQGLVARLGTNDINRPVVRLLTTPDGEPAHAIEIDLADMPMVRLMTPPRRAAAAVRPV